MDTQLDIFNECTDPSMIKHQLYNMENKLANVRRGLFARYGMLYKEFEYYQEKIDQLEKRLEKMER